VQPLPAWKVREAAARAQCQNNLKQITLATINCCDTYGGKIPPAIGLYPSYSQFSINNGEGGFFFFILPFIEQQDLYNACFSPTDQGLPDPSNNATGGRNNGLPTYVAWNAQALNQNIKVYFCPSDPTVGQGWTASPPVKNIQTSYAYNGQIVRLAYPGNWGLIGPGRYPAMITDGTSNTIFFHGPLTWVSISGPIGVRISPRRIAYIIVHRIITGLRLIRPITLRPLSPTTCSG
jgi:hypothetical protein